MLTSFFVWGVSLKHPVLTSFLCVEFLLHIPCWLKFYLGSFSYTSCAGLIFLWEVSLTHPMLASFLFFFFFFLLFFCFFLWEFLLHIRCLLYFSLGSFSYTTPAGFFSSSFFFFFSPSGEFAHPLQSSFLSGEVSIIHPVLASFFFFI